MLVEEHIHVATLLDTAILVRQLRLTGKHRTMLFHSEMHPQLSLSLPSPQVVSLLVLRLHVQAGRLPHFTAQDNPASFSNSTLTRTLTFHYLSAFNGGLLLAPITLSYDWQMGSIPLVVTVQDLRNAKTAFLYLVLASLLVRSLSQLKKVIHEDKTSLLVVGWSFIMLLACLTLHVLQM